MPYQLLLADDSVTIQRVIELTFADENVSVTTVGDGDQAVAAIDRSTPDIVLADINLPGLSGYDLARYVRDSARLAHIPVVLLAGAFDRIDEVRAAAAGCDHVLSKPFDPQDVILCVGTLLAGPTTTASRTPSLASGGRAAPDAEESGGSDTSLAYLDQTFASLGVPRRPEVRGDPDPFKSSGIDRRGSDDVSFDSTGGLSGLDALPLSPDPAERDRRFASAHDSSIPGNLPSEPQTADRLARASTPVSLVSDDLIDEIATRVMDRLLARLSAGNVPEVLTAMTERLVRAEFDRIRNRS